MRCDTNHPPTQQKKRKTPPLMQTSLLPVPVLKRGYLESFFHLRFFVFPTSWLPLLEMFSNRIRAASCGVVLTCLDLDCVGVKNVFRNAGTLRPLCHLPRHLIPVSFLISFYFPRLNFPTNGRLQTMGGTLFNTRSTSFGAI